MKRLLLILILTLSFQSWTKADDIRDFEIEGMSIGGSVLEFFTKKIQQTIPDTHPFYLKITNVISFRQCLKTKR